MPECVSSMIVEDDENDATFVKIALRRNNVTEPIIILPDGLEALRYLRGEPPYNDRSKHPFPHVIYTYLKMPRMDGFGLLAWLHGHPECCVIPVIVLSSSAQDRDIREAYTLGANAYIVKPNSIDDLTRILGVSMQFWKKLRHTSLAGQVRLNTRQKKIHSPPRASVRGRNQQSGVLETAIS